MGDNIRSTHVLGAGGMGVVVAALNVHKGERVAIKFMLPEGMTDRQMAARFIREARNAQRLTGEHVVRVIDVGTLDNGAPYLVMEHLEGQDLRGVAKFSAMLPIRDVVTYITQAAMGVAEAHALGIIHRDIKPPGNLFLTRHQNRACVKVLDFGISKTNDLTDSGDLGALTATSAVMGSPHYMSPEQMRSARSADARSDVWSLGVCLYQLLAGHVPFEAETLMELGAKVLHDPPVPLTTYRSDLPQGLVDIVMCCLEKDPGRRYATGGELANALERFAMSLPTVGKGPVPESVTAPAPQPGAANRAAPQPVVVTPHADSGKVDTAWGNTEPPRSKTPTIMLAGATLFGMMMGVFVWAVLLRGPALAQAPMTAAATDTAAQTTAPPAVPPAPSPTTPGATTMPTTAGTTVQVPTAQTMPTGVQPFPGRADASRADTDAGGCLCDDSVGERPRHVGRAGGDRSSHRDRRSSLRGPHGDRDRDGHGSPYCAEKAACGKQQRFRSSLRSMPNFLRPAVLASTLALLLSVGATARAADGPPPNPAAVALFEEGRTLMKAGKYDEACPKFEQSVAMMRSVGALLNLADCYDKEGKTASAWAGFRAAASAARDLHDPRDKVADARASALDSRVALRLRPSSCRRTPRDLRSRSSAMGRRRPQSGASRFRSTRGRTPSRPPLGQAELGPSRSTWRGTLP